MEKTQNSEIRYYHGTTDPTDYQVEDVLRCLTDGHGLQKGELYVAEAVTRRRTHRGVVTTVTVTANHRVVEVTDAEGFLRRTRVHVDIMHHDGRIKVHSFPDSEQLDVWCAVAHLPPNRIRNRRYVEAEPSPPADCRFTAMCVPGELDDGSDASWYVYDLVFRTSDKIGDGPQSRSLAIWMARNATRMQNESDQEEADHESV